MPGCHADRSSLPQTISAAILGVWLATMAPRAHAEAPGDLESAAREVVREIYPALLAKAGAKLQPGSQAWEKALAASVSAFLSARPDDCAVDDWLSSACGARPLITPSQAMAPSVQVGDMVFSLAVSERRPLRRGDVVAFRDPRQAGRANATIYLSRLIGMPGDRIRLLDGILHINGSSVVREAAGKAPPQEGNPSEMLRFTETLSGGRTYSIQRPVQLPRSSPTLETQENMAETLVPDGRYFLMGDNRLNSNDSRFAAQGEGPGLPAAGDIVGWVKTIYVSRDPKPDRAATLIEAGSARVLSGFAIGTCDTTRTSAGDALAGQREPA